MPEVTETADEARWITPGRAAAKLGVNTKTLARMADTGAITCITLPSGHHRYDEHEIDHLAAEHGA